LKYRRSIDKPIDTFVSEIHQIRDQLISQHGVNIPERRIEPHRLIRQSVCRSKLAQLLLQYMFYLAHRQRWFSLRSNPPAKTAKGYKRRGCRATDFLRTLADLNWNQTNPNTSAAFTETPARLLLKQQPGF
jgi:hypothetical protein